jgi:hypothetical protein
MANCEPETATPTTTPGVHRREGLRAELRGLPQEQHSHRRRSPKGAIRCGCSRDWAVPGYRAVGRGTPTCPNARRSGRASTRSCGWSRWRRSTTCGLVLRSVFPSPAQIGHGVDAPELQPEREIGFVPRCHGGAVSSVPGQERRIVSIALQIPCGGHEHRHARAVLRREEDLPGFIGLATRPCADRRAARASGKDRRPGCRGVPPRPLLPD